MTSAGRGRTRPADGYRRERIPPLARIVDSTGGQVLEKERVHKLSRRLIVAALSVFVTAAALACGGSGTAVARSASPPAPAPPADVAVQAPAPSPEVGSSVGDRTPEFEIRLADGTLVESASLLTESRPAFLFFFATW